MRPRTMKVRIATKKRQKGSLAYRAIVGLRVDGLPSIQFRLPHMNYGDDPRINTWVMPAQMAQRLDTFVRRHFMGPHDSFDSTSFAMFLTGMSGQSSSRDGRRLSYVGNPASASLLEPYVPYFIMPAAQAGTAQGLIGITREVGMGLLYTRPKGWEGEHELIIVRVSNLMTAAGADELVRLVHVDIG